MELVLQKFSEYAWGLPLLILLVGGGLYFMIYAEFMPFRYLGHAVKLLRGS
jgi:AGCS family alanine or glycine:cation symporter